MSATRPRIGLPRSLHDYLMHPYWRSFFAALDFEVVVREVTREQLPPLVHRFENELCLPVKYYLGQVELLQREGVDHLFAPLVYSLQKDTYACPKIIMLPDLIRLYFPEIDNALSPPLLLHYSRRRYAAFSEAAQAMAPTLGRSVAEVNSACAHAQAEDQSFETELRHSGLFIDEIGKSAGLSTVAEDAPRVLVLGHRYTTHNPTLANRMIDLLRRVGFAPLAKEHLRTPAMGVRTTAEIGIDTPIFFSEGAEIFRAAFYGARESRVDAVIYLAMFNCGFDAVIEDVVQRRILKRIDKPYLHLVLDEHATTANAVTRLEVFLDVVQSHRQRRQRAESVG